MRAGTEDQCVLKAAHVFVPVFALVPVIAFLGGGGFSALLGLAGLASLVWIRPDLRPNLPAIIFLAFLAWAAATETWSSSWQGWVSGSFTGGDFAVKSAGLRILLTGIFALVVIAAAFRSSPRAAEASVRVLRVGTLILLAVLGVASAMPVQFLGLFYDDPLQIQREGIQNLIRAQIALAIFLPVVTAPLWSANRWPPRLVAAALTLAVLAMGVRAGAAAVVLGMVLSLVTMLAFRLLPRLTAALSTAFPALLVATAPFWMWVVVGAGKSAGDSIGASSLSRVWSWGDTLARVSEAPILGHGLEASRSWTKTFSELEGFNGPAVFDNFRVVPGHPHSMPLEVWAEAGLVGALLLAAALLALALRTWRKDAQASPSGLSGVLTAATAFAPFLVSYSVWNEAFWAMVALALAAAVLMSRVEEKRS